MAKNQERIVKCSFCGKPQEVVKKIIAGPGVFICDECVNLCQDIIEEEVYDEDDIVEQNLYNGKKYEELYEELNGDIKK